MKLKLLLSNFVGSLYFRFPDATAVAAHEEFVKLSPVHRYSVDIFF